MSGHNHVACVHDALERAEEACRAHGAKLTPVRRRVLELVWEGEHRAAKTYDILAALSLEFAAAKPPTVYRALEFLEAQKLVHKVESLRGYVGCAHLPAEDGAPHACQFLICDGCGRVEEFCSGEMAEAVAAAAKKQKFAVARQVVEVHGACRECHSPEAPH